MKKTTPSSPGDKRKAELRALAKRPDAKIDTREMPEVRDWSKAKRGMLYRPLKQQLTLRLDADVLAWFKDHALKSEGYQTNINRALREHVEREERSRRRG
jgi:uncharacterized protein (DUF4415 family)